MKYLFTRGLLAGALLAGVACSSDKLSVPNYQNPTLAAASANPLSTLPLLATGVVNDDRNLLPGYYLVTGILGREAYNYTPTENRNVTGYLSSSVLQNTSFGGGSLWGYFNNLRDIFLMRTVATSAASGVFTAAQLSAINGFLDTWEGIELYYAISGRNQIGVPVQILANPTQLAPFVSRDSVYNYIVGKLTAAQTELAAGGSAFPFILHSGFAGFNTPATFGQFTSAFLARVQVARASLGVGGCAVQSPTCYTAALAALNSSFINPAGSFQTGPYQIYSTAAGDTPNADSFAQSIGAVLGHYKIDSGVVTQPNGNLDQRFLNKVAPNKKTVCSNSTTCVATTWKFLIYTLPTDPVWIIRNEELILLRAEAEYFTGNQAGALADINLIRTTSGNLAPRGAFTSTSDFITELLYNRRESLMFEGHQWLDKIRFNLLNTLPIDPVTAANDVLIDHLVIPQAECNSRIGAPANLAAPSNAGC